MIHCKSDKLEIKENGRRRKQRWQRFSSYLGYEYLIIHKRTLNSPRGRSLCTISWDTLWLAGKPAFFFVFFFSSATSVPATEKGNDINFITV